MKQPQSPTGTRPLSSSSRISSPTNDGHPRRQEDGRRLTECPRYQPETSVWERIGQPANLWVIVAACTALTPPILLLLTMLYALAAYRFDSELLIPVFILGMPIVLLVAVGIFLIRRVCELDLALKLYLPGDPSPPPHLNRIVKLINRRERQAVVVLPLVIVLILASTCAGSALFCYRWYRQVSDLSEEQGSFIADKLASRDDEIARLRNQNEELQKYIESNLLDSGSEDSVSAPWRPTSDESADEIPAG